MIVAGLMRGGPCNFQARAQASFSTIESKHPRPEGQYSSFCQIGVKLIHTHFSAI